MRIRNILIFFTFYDIKSRKREVGETVTIAQRDFGFAPRTVLKLCVVVQLIRRHAVIQPPPSRPKLIEFIEEGKIEGYYNEDLHCYFVFEDSFMNWLRRTAPPADNCQPIAA